MHQTQYGAQSPTSYGREVAVHFWSRVRVLWLSLTLKSFNFNTHSITMISDIGELEELDELDEELDE